MTLLSSLPFFYAYFLVFCVFRVAKFTKKSNHLVKECQKLLELVSVVVRLASNFYSSNNSNVELLPSSKNCPNMVLFVEQYAES